MTETCARCGHRSGDCPRCGRCADFLGAQINDGHYCHRDDVPPPSCYELTAMDELAATSYWWDDWDCPEDAVYDNWPPAFFAAAEGSETDSARRVDEILDEGFGR